MYQVDMHIHSSFSPDAEHRPEEVARLAKKTGLKAIVITDHNLITGISEIFKATFKYGLDTCCGIEISTKYKKTDFHILGYAKKFNEKILERGLKKTLDGYNERCQKIVGRCCETGIADIDFVKLLNKRRNSYVVRRDISEEIAKQLKISQSEAFSLINRGGPAFIPYGEWALSPKSAIELIQRAGGISVLAHPGDCYTRTDQAQKIKKILFSLIDEMIKVGLKGIEAVSSQHTPAMNKEFSLFAEKKKLFITGGSDWHGVTYSPKIQLGSSGINYQDFREFKKILP